MDADPAPLRRAEYQPQPWPHALVIDDDPDILDVYGLFLADEGFTSTLSLALVNVEDIVKLAPDIVLFDAMFHRTEFGTWFVEQCRAEHRLHDLPMLCCTASRTIAPTIEALNVQTILKPFDLETVLTAIHRTMKPAPATRRYAQDEFKDDAQVAGLG